MHLEVAEGKADEKADVAGHLEKLKKSFKYIKGCALLSRDGEIAACGIQDGEGLAFKLSILFDLGNLEEILIEGANGASYVKLFGDSIVYMEFNKKPNIPLLNMYLRKIVGNITLQHHQKTVQPPLPEVEDTSYKEEPLDGLLNFIVTEYLVHERNTTDIAREFRDKLRSRLNRNQRVKRLSIRVVPNIDGQVLEFIVIAVVKYSKGVIGTKDKNFEELLRNELNDTCVMIAEEIAAKLGMSAKVKCSVTFL